MATNAMHPISSPLENNKKLSFGTDGLRGKAGKVLSPGLVLQFGFWCSHVLPKEGPVLIGQDSRESGDMLTAALTAGLTAAGREVWQLGLCPTPVVPHLIKSIGASGGLMVSASHNPPEDNGIKIFDSLGEKINSEKQRLIESSLKGKVSGAINVIPTFTSFGKVYERHELLKDYENELIASVKGKDLKNLKIVLDLC